MIRWAAFIMAALGVLFGAPRYVFADDQAQLLRVPMIVIEAGREVRAGEVDRVVEGIDGPVLRGADLARRIGLLEPPGEAVEAAIRDGFTAAQDSFFSNDHGGARARLEELLSLLDEHPGARVSWPAVRQLDFETRLYLAIIEHGEGDEEACNGWLAQAVSRFPDLSPAPADFPPWVRERFARLRAELGPPPGAIELEVPAGCEVILDGRALGPGPRVGRLVTGARIARTRCLGRVGPLLRVTVTERGSTFRPLVLARSHPAATDPDLILEAGGALDGELLLDEVLSVARAGGFERLVAVVATAERLDVWLVDAARARVIRRGTVQGGDPGDYRRAGESLTATPLTARDSERTADQPWYRDGLAWGLVGGGLAALGAGIALGQVRGTPSEQEPWAWGLIAAGGGLAGTGMVLFFLPGEVAPERGAAEGGQGVAIGATGVWTF